jgi:PAS domain S-box-containing protein
MSADKILRVLNIEDSERDAMLLARHLSRAGYKIISERVDTSAAMKVAVESKEWDIILCDYAMPQFSAPEALELLKETGIDIPFIIISGTIGEEVAVEAMLGGAHDYLMKDNLTRLVAAIERELQEAANRRARRIAEAALRESEDRYRDLVENSRDLICTHDLRGRILSINETAAKSLGHKQRFLIGRDICDAIMYEFEEGFDGYITALLQDGIVQGTVPIKTKSGETRMWNYTNTLRTEGVAEPIVRGMAHDVTLQKQAEESLKASEAELRALFAAMTDVILVLDDKGRHLKMAPSRPVVGYKSENERIGKTLHEVFSEENAGFFLEHITRALNEGCMHRTEYSLPVGESEIWFEGSVSPMTENSVIWVARDITERKQAEKEQARLNNQLQSQRERLNNIVGSIPGVVWEAWGDPNSVSQQSNFVSDYLEVMLGYSVEEWLSTPNFWISIIHPEDKEQVASAVAASFISGEGNILEFRWFSKDGRTVWVESNFVVIRDDEGRPAGLRGVTIDITKRKMLEEQFRQAQKMEAIGQLAGGVAHDFNNLLTAIIGYSQLTLASLNKSDPLRSYIEEIQSAGSRAASLTNQLLIFSRKQVLQPRVLDLNAIVTDMNKLLRRLIGENIKLEANLEPELGCVKADSGQIEQVIMNLVVNARDAMPQGGQLSIETANINLDIEYAKSYIGITPGSYVMLAVSDSGSGMDKQTQARVFEPFFTTKEQGKGTGLGLSTVYGIVKQSEGSIALYSEPGQGTTFKIYLPRVDMAPGTGVVCEQLVSREQIASQAQGWETILLVEDEETVRNLAHRILQKEGYTVLEASNSGEALLICEQYEGPIHLIITDVVMPKMSGQQLVKRLAPLRPEMKTLYMSGYNDDAILHAGLSTQESFLRKPFMPDSLLLKVREALSHIK